jgi:hypothetical protein
MSPARLKPIYSDNAIESYAVPDFCKCGGWVRITPRSLFGSHTAHVERPVFGNALKLAKGPACCRNEKVHSHLACGQVIDRWVTGLQNPERVIGLSDSLSCEDNPHMVLDLLETRRPGIIPHRFLARARSYTFGPWVHKPTPSFIVPMSTRVAAAGDGADLIPGSSK